MGSKKKAPKAPDYTALANKQAAVSAANVQQQTQDNRPNQVTSKGSLTWSQDPATGRWTQTETLSPQMQAAQDSAMALQAQQMKQVSELGAQGPFKGGPAMPTYSPTGVKAGAMPTYANNAGQIADYAAGGGALPEYDQASGEQYAQRFTESLMGRLRPQQAQDQEKMAGKLRLQGLQPGTAAYDRAYKNLLTSQGDVNAQANLQGLMAGGQEARNVYQAQLAGQAQGHGQGLADYQATLAGQGQRHSQGLGDYQAQLAGQGQDFEQQLGTADNARQDYGAQLTGQQQGYGQEMQNFLMPYQTAALSQGLANGIQGPQFANFMGAGVGETPELLKAGQQQYAQAMQQYNEAAEAKSGKGSSLGSMAGLAAGSFFGAPTLGAAAGGKIGGMFSDATLKDNIIPISDEEAYNKVLGVRPYSFIWPNGRQGQGLLAQEVAEVFPHLVKAQEEGLLMVDYDGFTAILLGAFRHMAKKEQENGQSR